MNGTIINIQRFCINDGPGIRTTVFLKGCPLKCVWCHNPESQASACELMFYKEKCTGCGSCKTINEKNFVCQSGAKEICGKSVTADYVISEALRDKVFYDNSDGGLTLSGGDPLYQPEFSLEILKKAKKNSLHTAIETCGFSKTEVIKKISEYTDLFLFDYKETNSAKHKEFTGVSNFVILENLSLLNKLKKPVILRCPIIKGLNDREEHFNGIAETANKYENILHIEIEPYHPLGEGKNIALKRKVTHFPLATQEEKNTYLYKIQTKTQKNVIFA